MRQKKNSLTISLVTIFIGVCSISTHFLLGKVGIKFIERVNFHNEKNSSKKLTLPLAFCVTVDEIFIIPDYEAGDIKIYEKVGGSLELANTIGRKGFGIGDLQEPKYCFYDEHESKLGVIDYGLRKIFIYDRIGRIEFNRVQDFICLRLGFDIHMKNDKILVAGVSVGQDGNHYGLYYINLKNEKIKNLLPLYKNFGFVSDKDYKKNYLKKIPAIGTKSWFDIYNNEIYAIWEGDLRILKFKIKGGGPTIFGKKTSNYTKPFVSEELISARIKGDFSRIQNERSKMSFVRNIFVTSRYILLIYEGPGESNFKMQFYSLTGIFVKEVSIPGKPDSRMYFDKKGHNLYSLSTKITKNRSAEYIMLKYRIEE